MCEVGIQATCGSRQARRVRGNGGMFRTALKEPWRPVSVLEGVYLELRVKGPFQPNQFYVLMKLSN